MPDPERQHDYSGDYFDIIYPLYPIEPMRSVSRKEIYDFIGDMQLIFGKKMTPSIN